MVANRAGAASARFRQLVAATRLVAGRPLSAPLRPEAGGAAREWDARTWARLFARAAHIQTDETDPREAAAGPPPAPPWKALPREGAAVD